MNSFIHEANFKIVCIAGCVLLGSYTIFISGFAVLKDTGSIGVGLPLIFTGGIFSVISTFITCSMYSLHRKKLLARENTHLQTDAPPTYRTSWTTSFLSFSGNPAGEQSPLTSSSGRSRPVALYHPQILSNNDNLSFSQEDDNNSSYSANAPYIYEAQNEISRLSSPNRRFTHTEDHERSSTNGFPTYPPSAVPPATFIEGHLNTRSSSELPPSYDAALAAMDAASYERVLSALQSSSIGNNN